MLQRYLGLLIPSSINRPSQLMLARIIAFSAVISLLIALYSGIKWARLGNGPLVMGSLVLGLGMIGVLAVLRSGRLSLELVGNLALLFFYSYAMQLVYQLGGLHSAHIFWPVVLVVLAYVLVSPRSGAFWAAVSVVFVSWLIWLDRSGAALPVFELSPREEMINTWSGFLLPMITVWIAQWFNARQRNMAVAEAERGVEEVLQSGRQVELKEQQLAALVDEVRLSAGELLQMAGQLESTLAGVRQRCEAIDADSRAQAETMQQLDYLADQVLQQLSRTTAQMQELNQHTAVSSSQIEDCVSQMQEAEPASPR